VQPGLVLKEVQVPPLALEPVMHALPSSLAMGARQAIGLAGELEVDTPTCGVQFHFLNAPRLLQTQCAGEQRLNANTHLAILLSKEHRRTPLRWILAVNLHTK
jgi:hypothetical protein